MHVYTKHCKQESTQDVNMEIPEREKPRESTDAELSLCQKNTTRRHKGNDLVLTLFAWRRLQQRITLCLSLSLTLSLSLSLSLCVTLCIAVTQNNSIHHHTLFALGYIYTNMTFGLFTNIVTNRLTETYFHLCRLHLVRGSQWACVIRFSPGLSLPGTHIPSGGTEILTYETSRWLKYGAVLLTDPIYASWHSLMRSTRLINFLFV